LAAAHIYGESRSPALSPRYPHAYYGYDILLQMRHGDVEGEEIVALKPGFE
jgi:hypothetical protein